MCNVLFKRTAKKKKRLSWKYIHVYVLKEQKKMSILNNRYNKSSQQRIKNFCFFVTVRCSVMIWKLKDYQD
jgi:hypothetical protein